MIALPDGTDPAIYLGLREVDRAGLMWEWLRRDPSYVGWFVSATAATGGAITIPPRWHLLLAEDPARPAPEARILWRADLDPGALRVVASPAGPRDPDALPLAQLRDWISLVAGTDGREHVVVSDGLRHLRLEVEAGTLARGPVLLHHRIQGTRDADAKLLTLRRLISVCVDRAFPVALFPHDPRIDRGLLSLRVSDALRAGATQREVAELLFGCDHTRSAWAGASDALRSRVRRLVGEARRLAAGGYRRLMREG